MALKTPAMLRAEEEQGEQLETLLPRLINELGYKEAAATLHISASSINYLRLKLGIQIAKVALNPGDRYIIKSKRKQEQ